MYKYMYEFVVALPFALDNFAFGMFGEMTKSYNLNL